MKEKADAEAQVQPRKTVQEANFFSPKYVSYDPPLLICLSILFRLQGAPRTVDSLKAGLPQSEEGVSPYRCVRAALRHGMRANIVRKADVRDINRLTMPCILLLKGGNACVLQDVRDDKAKVIFPEYPEAAQLISLDNLQEEYTGHVFFGQMEGRLDERASDITLVEDKKWFWGTILTFLPIYKYVALASVIVNLLIVASPLFVMNVYDRVVPNNAVETLWVLAVGIGIIYVFDFLLRNLRSYFLDVAGRNADVIIASKLMRHMMAMRMDNKPEASGAMANNLREFESLREFFSSTTFQVVIDFPFLILFILIIWHIGGPLAWIPTLVVPVVIGFGVFIQQPFQRVIQKSFKEATQKYALLVEIINGLESVKTSLAEGRMQHLWEKVVGMNANTTRQTKTLANLSVTLSMFASQLVSVLIIIWGVYLIKDGELTMGGLIACNILAGRAMAPMGAVAGMLTRLQQSKMALKSLNMLMETPCENPEEGAAFTYDHLEPTITFQNVTFAYPGSDQPALSDISFTIRRGERVGVIGQMGSGKTTLGRLMVGLYQPREGTVKVGDVDIRQVDIANLRRNVGYVSQDNFLFYGSIKDNICIGNPSIDDQSVLRAASLAGVMDFVVKHPAGFALPVGERGQAISGGQRQSVAIARALLHDPDIVILDEPTSNMDQGAEMKLKARLKGALKGKTVVLITHRMSMLDLVDKLLLLDGGKVVAYDSKVNILATLKERQIRESAEAREGGGHGQAEG